MTLLSRCKGLLQAKANRLKPQRNTPDEFDSPAATPPDALVTIGTFQPVMRPHAQMLQAMLESQGIVCILNGQWHTDSPLVCLQVRSSDAAVATELIDGSVDD